MLPIVLYLLKANAALLLFAAAYFGLLRRLTFFQLNRVYLVFALLFAAGYPALPVPALLPAEATPTVAFTMVGNAGAAVASAPAVPAVGWAAVGVALYGAGAAGLLARLLGQLLSVWRLRARSRPAVVSGLPVRVPADAVSPFSFGRTIYLDPAQHPAPELAAVLRHEQVHVRQWHTLDVLLAQLALAAAWCNPAAWLLRRALLDNLEYLADHAVLAAGLDRRAYQYSLLRLSHGAAGPSLVSHFTFPTLKNRVLMMNTPLSSTGQLARYFVTGPLVLAAALGFSGARAQGAGPVAASPAASAATSAARPASAPDPVYYVDGQPYTLKTLPKGTLEQVFSMKMLRGAQVQQALGADVQADRVVVVVTQTNRSRADVVAFDKRMDAAGALDTHFKLGARVDPAQHQLPDGIRAYIARTYPQGKLSGWGISEQAAAKPPHIKYFAMVREDGQVRKLYFNAAEQPVERSETADASATSTSATPGLSTAPATPLLQDAFRCYLDGQVYTGDTNLIKPEDIASINVYKGQQASAIAGPAGASGIIVITTKSGQLQPDVLDFNAKLARLAPGAPPTAVGGTGKAVGPAYLAAPALAYITKTYPGARLVSVTELTPAAGGAPRYRAEIAVGRRPQFLDFDAQGQHLKE